MKHFIRMRMAFLPAFGCLLVSGQALFAATLVTASLDSAGQRMNAGSYVVDGSLNALGGVATAGWQPVAVRHGYAGQLYDLQNLQVNASPASVGEGGACQFGALAVASDATLLALPNTNVVWRVLSGPLVSIDAGGLALTTNVYQDTVATVQATCQGLFGTGALTVRNVSNDDFGIYAQDGIDDAWQVRYFGLNNRNAVPTADPDHDGADNYHEYIADTDPTNALSYFHVQRVVGATNFQVWFQSSASRKYTLYCATNLPAGGWTNLPFQTDVPGSGSLNVLTDSVPAGSRLFYRVGVRLP